MVEKKKHTASGLRKKSPMRRLIIIVVVFQEGKFESIWAFKAWSRPEVNCLLPKATFQAFEMIMARFLKGDWVAN